MKKINIKKIKLFIYTFLVMGFIFFIVKVFSEINIKTGQNVSNIKYIEWKKLKESNENIDEKDFYIMGFSQNNEYILARNKVKNPELIQQSKIRLITKINTDNLNIENYYLPLQSIEQYLNLDNENILLLGNNGNYAGVFNINTGKLRTIIQNKEGKKGFRFTNFVLKDGNKIYVEGYFFDENQVAEDENNYWVEFYPEKTELNAFGKKIVNTTEIVKKLGKVRMFYYAKPDLAVFTRMSGMYPTELWAYINNKLTKIDTQEYIIEIALSKNADALYLYKKGKLSYFCVYNLITKKRIDIPASQGRPFIYPFITPDGNVAVVSYLNLFNKKMDFYIGFKQNDYKLNELVSDVKMGSFKLAEDGSKFSLLNEDGVIIGNIIK